MVAIVVVVVVVRVSIRCVDETFLYGGCWSWCYRSHAGYRAGGMVVTIVVMLVADGAAVVVVHDDGDFCLV